MAELVADCPRCDAKKITFDLLQEIPRGTRYEWQHFYEVFCVCRHCRRSTVFVLSDKDTEVHAAIKKHGGMSKLVGAVNAFLEVEGFINLSDMGAVAPPEYLPAEIEAAFNEGAKCISVGCHNAAGTMFRLCIDLASREKLPPANVNGLNAAIRRNLGLRLPWLFDNQLLPEALRDLSHCVKEDGNDGAHAGSLSKEDAEDLLDFATALLERLYTEPERLKLAQSRRDLRRAANQKP